MQLSDRLSSREIDLSKKSKEDEYVLRAKLRKRLQILVDSNENKAINIIKSWTNINSNGNY